MTGPGTGPRPGDWETLDYATPAPDSSTKVKIILVYATNARGDSRGTVPFILNLGNMEMSGQRQAPTTLPQGKNPVLIKWETVWSPEPV